MGGVGIITCQKLLDAHTSSLLLDTCSSNFSVPASKNATVFRLPRQWARTPVILSVKIRRKALTFSAIKQVFVYIFSSYFSYQTKWKCVEFAPADFSENFVVRKLFDYLHSVCSTGEKKKIKKKIADVFGKSESHNRCCFCVF